MGKHTLVKSTESFMLMTSLKTHTEAILARLAKIETRLTKLRAMPRADATIWKREGKTGTTYYLVHKQNSPRFITSKVSRRERIGRGDRCKSECEEQIQRYTEYQVLSTEQKKLEGQYDTAIHHIRAAINATGQDQPDGQLFQRRWRDV
ncbi:MAG: hypothetical protein U9O54_03665 [Chloroflexota bacterium]|nr:hypothetical protein [Chloroflexota bacterium]